MRRLDAAEGAGGRGRGMNGTHRSLGIWIAVGPGSELLRVPARLQDVAPWLARAMGLAWDAQQTAASGSGSGRVAVAYDDAEEAMVAERMRALGYLE